MKMIEPEIFQYEPEILHYERGNGWDNILNPTITCTGISKIIADDIQKRLEQRILHEQVEMLKEDEMAKTTYETRTMTFYSSKCIDVYKIIFNGPACVVIWDDGEKTIVKKMDDSDWDPYAAVAQALAKRIYNSTSHFHKIVDEKSKYQYPKSELTEEGCYV